MLLAYDAGLVVVGTLSHCVARDEAGHVIGLIDFVAHEAADGEHTDIWVVSNATGSKVWPEWLGSAAHAFRVELEGPPGRKRIAALVHRESGHRRERAEIEAAIDAVEPDPATGARDIRHLVGGPTRPLELDAPGRTVARPGRADASRPRHIP